MLLGGDRRTLFLAQLFNKNGITDIWGLDLQGIPSADISRVREADIIVLPYPCFQGDKLRSPMAASSIDKGELLEMCRGKTVFSGAPSADFVAEAQKNGTRVFDYATEALLKDNAFLTAEGALGIAVSDMPRSVLGSVVLVLGCGRIGRELACLLEKLGADVTVTAMRQESRLWAETNGFDFIRTDIVGSADLKKYHGIFNTIPMPIFGEAEIRKTNSDCLLTELASLPGGIDFAAAKALGRNFVNAQGLPGKTSPMSASEIIYREIMGILKTEEI